jgi:hypothetical protein
MLIGKPPFYKMTNMDCKDVTTLGMMQRIKDGNFDVNTEEWQFVSEQAKSLITGSYESILL